jgi:hypothetical protein
MLHDTVFVIWKKSWFQVVVVVVMMKRGDCRLNGVVVVRKKGHCSLQCVVLKVGGRRTKRDCCGWQVVVVVVVTVGTEIGGLIVKKDVVMMKMKRGERKLGFRPSLHGQSGRRIENDCCCGVAVAMSIFKCFVFVSVAKYINDGSFIIVSSIQEGWNNCLAGSRSINVRPSSHCPSGRRIENDCCCGVAVAMSIFKCLVFVLVAKYINNGAVPH